MKIRVCGAAGGEVTGSAYFVETATAKILVDAGLFQGSVETNVKNQLPRGIDPAQLDAVLITHAHLDHTGRVPLLMKLGYRGPIFATNATFDLSEIILKDSAKIQAQDALRINRKRERAGEPPIEPLYTPEHVELMGELRRPSELNSSIQVARGIRARYFEAGHLLGSASIELTLQDGDAEKIVVFSGDLGPIDFPILHEFNPPDRADLVFLESTYGDRDHRDYAETVAEFFSIVGSVSEQRGKILVPTFAVGRAQQILYHLTLLFRESKIRPFPVFLDSPMAIEATKVFHNHAELFDDEMRALNWRGIDPIDPSYFRASVTADDSKKLNEIEGPCVILAGAGMCTGGRILHHFKQNLWKRDTHVLIVGYQAVGSLGRQLVEGAETVWIHGERIAVRGQIHTLGGFSAHAGQGELLKWFAHLAPSRPRVVLTHGENPPRIALAEQIRSRFQLEASLPELDEVIIL